MQRSLALVENESRVADIWEDAALAVAGGTEREHEDSRLGLEDAKRSIIISSLLSTVVALTDTLTLVGLSILLSATLPGVDVGLARARPLGNVVVVVLLALVTLGLNMATNAVREKAVAEWTADRRLQLVRAFRCADYRTQSRYSGAALSSIADQIGRAASSISSMVSLINSAIRAVIYLAVAFVASWVVSLVAIGSGMVMVFSLTLLARRTRAIHRSIAGRQVRLGEHTGELATAARELYQLRRWEIAEADLAEEVNQVRHLNYRAAVLAQLVGPLYWTGTVLVGVAVAIAARSGTANAAGLATSGLLLLRAMNAGQGVQTMYQAFNDARPYVDRVGNSITELRSHRRPALTGQMVEHIELTAQHISLSHGNDRVIHGLDARIGGNGGIAIVGPSGSGKSSLLASLAGLLRPDEGDVCLDGYSIYEMEPEVLSGYVGLLPQDPKLLVADLRSNLTCPSSELSDNELFDILEAVGLSETVGQFASGLDTLVGRGGEGFSGGELQRLALARLMVNQPDIWLLDEPTSALDRANANRVAGLIADAMEQRLVVVVTHRADLLAACRRVLVVIDGKLVDDGTVAEVAERQPFLAHMLAGEELEEFLS